MLKYFDPHIHMVSRTTDDYQNMAAVGITGVIEPAFWQGQARTSVGSFIDYFDTLLGWERFRASMFGIHHFCTIGLNPKEANDLSVANEVLEILPRYLVKDGVVAPKRIAFSPLSWSWPSNSICRCWCTPRTATRSAAPNAPWQ
jgi:predicted metal-dependent TIM-barrel fold hydrolase